MLKLRRPKTPVKPKPKRKAAALQGADALARKGILQLCNRLTGFGSAMVWTVLGVLFVLWVVLKATGFGITEVVRDEWRVLRDQSR